MILTDTGPIVALLDVGDSYHALCMAAVRRFRSEPLLSTWICFTEAMFLLGTAGGHRVQMDLWRLYTSERLVLHDLTFAEGERMAALMERYKDTPMDLADASLIAVAESRSLRQVFTIDSDFYIYRLADGSALEVIP